MAIAFRDELVKQEIDKPWCCKEVTRVISNMLYWVNNDYRFTEEQKEQLAWLREAVDADIR